jgi:hypothetical protein
MPVSKVERDLGSLFMVSAPANWKFLMLQLQAPRSFLFSVSIRSDIAQVSDRSQSYARPVPVLRKPRVRCFLTFMH